MVRQGICEHQGHLGLSDHSAGYNLARIGTLVQANGLLARCEVDAAQRVWNG